MPYLWVASRDALKSHGWLLQHVATILGINGRPHRGSALSRWSDIWRESMR